MNAILLTITGLFSFTLFLTVHFIVWQLPSADRGFTPVVKLSLLAALIVLLVAGTWGELLWADLLWVSLPIHLFLSLFYFHWYIAMYRSLSVRIMGELILAGGTITLSELDRVYPLDEMFMQRLKLLEEEGWIRAEDGYYVSTPKGRKFGSVIRFARKIYGFRKAG